MDEMPGILPVREQSKRILELVRIRLETILPEAMQRAGLDMWIILSREDNLDPVYTTMLPMDCWCPILQMLVFVRERDGSIRRYSVYGTDTKDLYERPYTGQLEEEQWKILVELVKARDPETIGVHTGDIKWAAAGLAHTLYQRLVEEVGPRYASRLISAERAVVHWSAVLTDQEIAAFRTVADIARRIIARCYSRGVISPGVTSVDDLEWHYWQTVIDMGLALAFKPFFKIIRSNDSMDEWGGGDRIVRPGDIIHCDVGIKYLRLNSDNQQLAYVLGPGENDAPKGLRRLMSATNRLQDVFMGEFESGRTGNELLRAILDRARREEIPRPKVYSHSLGLFLHQPGPLIGLPWEQGPCLPRGETELENNMCFTMELSAESSVAEWNGQLVRCPLEEDVVYTTDGCALLDVRQTEFYLI